MTVTAQPKPNDDVTSNELIISADSHVVEPLDLWKTRLPARLRDQVPDLPKRPSDKPGGTDPADRLAVMQADGVSMEVLYPTYGLTQFRIDDPALQEACFSVYNDWLMEYCAGTPGRLVGIPSIPAHNIDHGIVELERTHSSGLTGCEVWHVPPANIPFSSDHYERLWAACQELNAPVHLHILSGFTSLVVASGTVEQYRRNVEAKLMEAIHVLFDFIFYGVLDRYPRLKLVLVEFEMGWIPWLLQQWDYYVHRFAKVAPTGLELLPSEYFARQVYVTFFNDEVGTRHFKDGWGLDNCMWSNDFPHQNTTWPNSREVIGRDLGELPESARSKLLRENVTKLYHLETPSPIQDTTVDATK